VGLCSLAGALHPQLAAQSPPGDSGFRLSTTDPRRSPSPFIGNGRIGVVIPPLGIGATPSIAAGLYEHGPGDVPRIAAVWETILDTLAIRARRGAPARR